MPEGTNNSNETSVNPEVSKVAKAKQDNRRRMLKAAVMAAPLIVTLRGKSAHAQLSSLGSIQIPGQGGIMYGPGAYVVPGDTFNGKTVHSDWHHLPKNQNGILKDPTRRGLQTDVIADPSKSKADQP